MITIYSTIIISFLIGTNNNPKPLPEEIALEFLVDSLINKPLFSSDRIETSEEQIIHIEPIIPKKIYAKGFLNGFKLFSEGLAYGFPEAAIPFPRTKKEYKEFGHSKLEIKRFKRIIEASSENYFNPSYKDTIDIEMPILIQKISLETDKDLIQEQDCIYIRVFKALETEKEYLVQLTLYEGFVDLMHYATGFILEFIISKNNDKIEWNLGGSYH